MVCQVVNLYQMHKNTHKYKVYRYPELEKRRNDVDSYIDPFTMKHFDSEIDPFTRFCRRLWLDDTNIDCSTGFYPTASICHNGPFWKFRPVVRLWKHPLASWGATLT